MWREAIRVGSLLEVPEAGAESLERLTDTPPLSSCTEMIVSVYESQKRGARVRLPLKDRRHPLETW